MKHQQTLATLLTAVLCSGVLVLFTDVEQDLLQQWKRFTQPRLERRGHVEEQSLGAIPVAGAHGCGRDGPETSPESQGNCGSPANPLRQRHGQTAC